MGVGCESLVAEKLAGQGPGRVFDRWAQEPPICPIRVECQDVLGRDVETAMGLTLRNQDAPGSRYPSPCHQGARTRYNWVVHQARLEAE